MQRKTFRSLLLVGALAGLFAALVFRRNLAAEASMAGYFGFLPPGIDAGSLSAEQVRALFSKPLVGLVFFDSFDVLNVTLVVIMLSPAFLLCWRRRKSAALPGGIAIILCLALYAVSNKGLIFLPRLDDPSGLSDALARSAYCEAGATIALFLLYASGLYFAATMKAMNIFSRFTFIFGMIANGIGILYFPLRLLGMEYDYFAIVLAAPFTVAWHVNISINLLKERRSLMRRETAPLRSA
jgi:hypothetical protein